MTKLIFPAGSVVETSTGKVTVTLPGSTQAFVGYDTIGASWETVTSKRVYYKKIVLTTDTNLTSIDVHLRPSTDQVGALYVVLAKDNAGAPGVLLADAYTGSLYLSNSSSMPGDGRWFSVAVGAHLSAGTYWIGFTADNTYWDVAYDTGGSDQYFGESVVVATGAYPSAWSITTGSRSYSIRANTWPPA